LTKALEERFAARWVAAGAPKRLLLAVSGGGDSVALMRLAARLSGAGVFPFVATVDHGLRPASALEADFVLNEAAALGLPAVTLRWHGEKPSTGLQATARDNRYRLLAAEAERIGADAILTAHTQDDQVETILMRIAHRTGVDGLAGMAEETAISKGAGPPQRLLRLLLGEQREDLRDYVGACGARFIDDPSNDEPRFERVRMRRFLNSAPGRDALFKDSIALAVGAGALKALSIRLGDAGFKRAGGAFLADGSISLGAIDDARLAARLIHAAGGGAHAPDADAAAAAFAAALSGRRVTLSGALIDPEGKGLLIRREPAAILGRSDRPGLRPLAMPPGSGILWDRRFAVENVLASVAELRPLGDAARALGAPRLKALATAPGLFIGGELAAFPGDDGQGDLAIRNLVPERIAGAVIRF